MQDNSRLLYWYDRNARDLPWRILPKDKLSGVKPNPYHVWLSEIMLQQTTVATVKSYYKTFINRWPTLQDLAAADEEELLKAWAGLGYYSRARNLHRCAREVTLQHNGRLPNDEQRLLKLPGIGPYTAAAITAIAFDAHAAVVDGNVERVVSRYFGIEEALPASKPLIKKHMHALTPQDRPGDFAQAMMDLGATICSPRKPECTKCPWQKSCKGYLKGIAETLPRKAAKQAKPVRFGVAFIVKSGDGSVLLRKRGDQGLLAGMSEPLTSEWCAVGFDRKLIPSSEMINAHHISIVNTLPKMLQNELAEPLKNIVDKNSNSAIWEKVNHSFTHFHCVVFVGAVCISHKFPLPDGYWWSAPTQVDGEALPTIMKKIASAGSTVLSGDTRI
ncbi:A/G-specific adenine glycosylase [Polycladidibacter stylochi]|uniref:A/G-specific adenine glycosylase n=1 Tax=Polycladidibacter stylochi TaxID=1807766 RepID=UPI00082BD1D1|nr:A/G-specific adenine glycosylase [Pseudovibrio stylochi]